MTLDELKATAKEMGYKLIKITTPEKKLGCKACGASNRKIDQWYGPTGTYYRCRYCGVSGDPAQNEKEARKLWNSLNKQ